MSIRDVIRRGNRNEGLARQYEDTGMLTFQREMNRLFDDFLGGFELAPLHKLEQAHMTAFVPKINISETEKEIKVSAELPGMDEKEVFVEMEEGALSIRGEKKQENEEKGKNWHRIEQSYGAFHRLIPIPVNVDGAMVKATFKKGLLNVSIPKVEDKEKAKKKIEITAE